MNRDKLSHLFKNIQDLEPDDQLKSAILCTVKKAKIKQIRRKLIFSELGLLGSTAAVFYTLFIFGQSLLKSEFWSMISLVFTDAETVMSNWHDFLYSMMETFPVMTIVIILLPIFILLVSLDFYFNLSNKNNFKHVHPGACA